jgi:hypothetical protein
MLLGAVSALFCRRDLTRKTFYGGFLFVGFYVVFLQGLELLSRGYIERYWKLSALSGVMVGSMPGEELLFAFTLGMYWTGVYEHVTWTAAIRSAAGGARTHDDSRHAVENRAGERTGTSGTS